MKNDVTRGNGILENFLAKKRASLADSLIPNTSRDGRILDIGCGSFPYFLSQIKFKERFGLDQVFLDDVDDIKLVQHNLINNNTLPFSDNYFTVVTALAFLEHLREEIAEKILRETYRVLKFSGLLIIAVPRKEVDLLLKLMAKIKLVSNVEINEHQQFYSKVMIKKQLLTADFKKENIKVSSFELGMNLFAVAKK